MGVSAPGSRQVALQAHEALYIYMYVYIHVCVWVTFQRMTALMVGMSVSARSLFSLVQGLEFGIWG